MKGIRLKFSNTGRGDGLGLYQLKNKKLDLSVGP